MVLKFHTKVLSYDEMRRDEHHTIQLLHAFIALYNLYNIILWCVFCFFLFSCQQFLSRLHQKMKTTSLSWFESVALLYHGTQLRYGDLLWCRCIIYLFFIRIENKLAVADADNAHTLTKNCVEWYRKICKLLILVRSPLLVGICRHIPMKG